MTSALVLINNAYKSILFLRLMYLDPMGASCKLVVKQITQHDTANLLIYVIRNQVHPCIKANFQETLQRKLHWYNRLFDVARAAKLNLDNTLIARRQ